MVLSGNKTLTKLVKSGALLFSGSSYCLMIFNFFTNEPKFSVLNKGFQQLLRLPMAGW